jgi:salicylate hydroxylase
VFERAAELTEVGAGIQMGPHVMRRLHAWGLEADLRERTAVPAVLKACDALRGGILATLPLAATFQARYGAPYATIHRADLQTILWQAVQREGRADVTLHSTGTAWVESVDDVHLQLEQGENATRREVTAGALIGADGLWSRVRASGWSLPEPAATGHLAYRAMVPQVLLPQRLRSQDVSVWMGPHLHLVTYPVRQGEWLNVVLLLQPQGPVRHVTPGWDMTRAPQDIAQDLQWALKGCCAGVRDLVGLIEQWRVWPLYARTPVAGPDQIARGRVALLGDAAHPMLPYLAQGAGMAIEDADCLAQWWAREALPVPQRLHRYAEARWQRNARVQLQSRRNADVFHATGLMKWGRDLGLKLIGQRLMDQPWLFEG